MSETAIEMKPSFEKKKRRVIRRKKTIPDEIVNNGPLNEAMTILPSNYNFEIHKTVWRIRETGAKKVALQFPEGLLMYSCVIVGILEKFTSAECLVMGDVSYGACCIDDFTASRLECDLMFHYGHSCLIPVNNCKIPVVYIFVTIQFDTRHLVESVKANFLSKKIALLGTIQFSPGVHTAKRLLAEECPDTYIRIPQTKPLSPGEVLGCTSPILDSEEFDIMLFVADGRFHIESALIANPTIPAYKYNPYLKKITTEEYGHGTMKKMRQEVISKASTAKHIGIVLGTLGRQGSKSILTKIEKLLKAYERKYTTVLMAELSPKLLSAFTDVDAWVEIACPRLAIDWGTAFEKPLLTPYELSVALGETEWKEVYPMDWYKKEGGPWSNYSVDEMLS
eukprot:TRINITY_DN781927_c0_g1_i1.p1 TRINITY_DN781927_c0_g1~~TRINITY_DN781927_c0_g1_i1.p1  ORF type:complete len:394 (-),score=100.17 TRINITY_DN781927_c0_g1_i1:219-1400(-)